MERSKEGIKESHDSPSLHNQNTILINIIWNNFTRHGKSTMKFN